MLYALCAFLSALCALRYARCALTIALWNHYYKSSGAIQF
jgi:hypothetical protein